MDICLNKQGKNRSIRTLIWLTIFSLILSNVALTTSSAEEVSEQQGDDTVVFSFTELGLPDQSSQPGWNLVGDPDTQPNVESQNYGVHIQSTMSDATRSFEFEVPETAEYWIKLSGYQTPDGGTADVLIDGVKYGQYSFHTFTENYGSLLPIETLELTAGKHTLTLTVAAEGNGRGDGEGTNMYPHSFVLLNLDEVTNSKTRSTYYTTEKVEAARQNVTEYDWAKNERDQAVGTADKYLSLGYEGLWNLVPSQNLPRSYNTNQFEGNLSPVTGEELNNVGNYPWIGDPINDPWKITDPTSGYKFPTNDFGAYYQSGLDEHGNFDPERADRSLLVNTLYPEKGPKWGVDDGFGWVDPETGKRYTFIAYYVHWFLWSSSSLSDVPPAIKTALNAFRDAYIYTGDEKYARAGIILLDRIADVYPSMDISSFDSSIYLNSHGSTDSGKILGSIWETRLAQDFAEAYDAFFPAMDDPEVINFLSEKGEQYDLPLKTSATGIKRNIEDGILRQIYPAIQQAKIRGNTGMHQSTLAMAAIVLDTLPETKEWLDFNFQAGGLDREVPLKITGGNILASMVNDIDRDGAGNEGSPGYTSSWIHHFLGVADILAGYDKYPVADLYQNVKFRKMFDAWYPLTMLKKYTPSIGDTAKTGNPVLNLYPDQMITAFEQFGDPIYAQIAYFLNRNTTDGIHGDIFSTDPEAIAREIDAVIDEHGTWQLDSTNSAGYGFAALRDGVKNRPFTGIGINFSQMEVTEASTDYQLFEDSGTIQFNAEEAGHRLSFKFEVPQTDEYEINLKPFKAGSYGIYDILIDGERITTFDFYGSSGASSPLEVLTELELTAGEHTITFVGDGKRPEATNYKLGVIQLQLLDEAAQKVKNIPDNTMRGTWMYYGRSILHGHKDTLNLGLHAFDLDLMPDLGYPEQASSTDHHRMEWVDNTISHNTVVVDQSKQQDQWVAKPTHFDDSDRVKLMDVEAPDVYPQTDLYKRTTAMIKVDEANSYVVDFFRVHGGDDHHLSFHGAEGDVATDGLSLVPQTTGTYAGPDVPFGERPEDDSVPGGNYDGPGFHWLKNVERDNDPKTQFSADWNVKDTWNVYGQGAHADTNIHMRLTMLGDIDEVALADGVPPRNKPGNPESLRYLMAHRTGEDLNSVFTSVIEPYKTERFIQSIHPVEVKVNETPVDTSEDTGVRAVKVQLTNGRTDYIVSALDPNVTYTIDDTFTFKGFFGVYSEKDGEQVYGYLNDGTVLGDKVQTEKGALTGSVVDFTKELSVENEIVVDLDQSYEDLEGLAGSYIYVETDGERNGAYRIEGIKAQDGNRVTFDLGDITLVRRYVDSEDFSKGFIYNIAEGSAFTIPLATEREIVTVSQMLNTLDTYREDLPSKGVYRSLEVHLISVGRFEQKGAADKVVKHMEGFQRLLDIRKDNDQISEAAYNKLSAEANALLKQWQ